MPYTPPAGDNVTLVMKAGYVPPLGTNVILVFGAQDGDAFADGIDSMTFGTTDISHRIRYLTPSGIAPQTAVGTPLVDLYTRYLVGTGNISTMTFPTAHRVENKNRQLLQVGNINATLFGTTKIENKNKEYAMTGFATAAYGSPTLSRNPQVATSPGFNSLAFGTTTVYKNKLETQGFNAAAYGNLLITLKVRFVYPYGFDAMQVKAPVNLLDTPLVRRNQVFCIGFNTGAVGSGTSATDPNRSVTRAGALNSMAFGPVVVTNTKISMTVGDCLAMGSPQVWPQYIRPTGKDYMYFPIRKQTPVSITEFGVTVYTNKLFPVGFEPTIVGVGPSQMGKPAISENPRRIYVIGFTKLRFGFNDFTLVAGDTYPGVGRFLQVPPLGINSMQFGTAQVARLL